MVREPKEDFVGKAEFSARNKPEGATTAGIDAYLQPHADAALRRGSGEAGVVNRGFASYANGYAAAIGAHNHGGPKVFMLSQARLANPSTTSAEVARLAAFLDLTSYTEPPRTQQDAARQLGNVSLMTSAQVALTESTFTAPTVDPRVVALFS